MLFYEFTPTTLMGVSVSNKVSREIGVHRTPSSSMLLVKMLAKTDFVSKNVSKR